MNARDQKKVCDSGICYTQSRRKKWETNYQGEKNWIILTHG